jgi:uncharacterized protein (TIGR02391 family)
MLNIEPRLDGRLWAAIDNAYQSGNYTGAILDSIHFIGELIREKSGLDGDGVQLVGQAFGGQNPKVKVTKLQTETDENIQKGVEQFLRGIYQAIRNPRSHGKFTDSVEDAEVIILFINYLVNTIDKAKGAFDKEAFLQQVFDPYFTENNRYADLLVGRIPQGKRWEILLAVYQRKEEGKGQKLLYFITALLKVLTPEEIDEFCEVVSQELETASNETTIRAILQIVPEEFWNSYSEVARIRTEGKLIEAVRVGRYDPQTNKCLSGGLATWGVGLLSHFILKDKLSSILATKLDSLDDAEREYVFQFFLSNVLCQFPTPSPILMLRIKRCLKSGDVRVKDVASAIHSFDETNSWIVAMKQEVDAFVTAQKFNEPITDEDVPF